MAGSWTGRRTSEQAENLKRFIPCNIVKSGFPTHLHFFKAHREPCLDIVSHLDVIVIIMWHYILYIQLALHVAAGGHPRRGDEQEEQFGAREKRERQ